MTLGDRFYRMFHRRRAYRACFLNERGELTPDGRVVLDHLAQFCRAHRSTVVVSPVARTVDTHATMLAEGRREVFNLLAQYLGMTEEQLLQLKPTSEE